MAILFKVQVNIVLSILLLILICHAYLSMNRKVITNRLFIWLMGLVLFNLILETLSDTLNKLVQFFVLCKIVNLIGFLITPVILLLGYIFTKEWVNRYQKDKIKVNKILFLPLIIYSIIALVSYNDGGLFYITNDNTYVRGQLFFILPVVSYMYFVYNLYFIFKCRKKFTNSELIIFSTFYIVPAIFTFLQILNSTFLTIWSSASIVIVVTYIFILNDQSYCDSLTNLRNRLYYEHYAQNISSKRLKRLIVIFIDLDDFKYINDQFGHLAGDETIKAFADLLVLSFPFRHNRLIRFGGDEFIILLEGQMKENAEAGLKILTHYVDEYNDKINKPYKIKFSYGIAVCNSNHKNIKQLLECADHQLYENKQNRKHDNI